MTQWKQRLLLRLLDEYRLAFRAEGKERAEDAVLDLMNSLEGWCHPDARLENFIGAKR